MCIRDRRITIRELRTSAIVTGGIATFDILDHVWYDNYEDFMAVKVMMQRDMRCSPDQDEAHLFSGFLFCGDCQQPMIRKTCLLYTSRCV